MFRAYADASGADKEEGECDDDDGNRYSSFDQEKILAARAKKENIAKAQRIAERIKNQNALRYINSDSDEDDAQIHVELPAPSFFTPISAPRVDLPVEKKKKKKKKKTKPSKQEKHKTRKKKQRKSSSSSSNKNNRSDTSSGSSSESDNDRSRRRKTREPPKIVLRKEKWGFLGYKEESSVEGTFIVFDHQYDHENFNMDAIPKGHTFDYRQRCFTILNGNSRLDELFFSKELRQVAEKRKTSDRYFHGILRKLDDSTAERKFRKLKSPFEASLDYVELSKTKLQEFEFLHQIVDRKAIEKEREALELEVAASTPSHAAHLETRRRLITIEFANGKNIDVLEQFLKINEEVFEMNRISGMPFDRRALAERQISIIDEVGECKFSILLQSLSGKAISSNRRVVELHLKKLEYQKDLLPKDELLKEWEKILNVFVSNCSAWSKYLDFIQYDSALYSEKVLNYAFDRCFNKLTSILDGTFKCTVGCENVLIQRDGPSGPQPLKVLRKCDVIGESSMKHGKPSSKGKKIVRVVRTTPIRTLAYICRDQTSHKIEPNTESFLLHTYVRRLLWWMESGQTNRAIASIQASIEYNFLVPDSLLGASEEKKREAFANFWNSGAPRFGDDGSSGWRNFHETLENLEDVHNRERVARALQEQKTQELEERIAFSADSLMISWVEMEREMENIESRPRRHLPEEKDKDDTLAMKEVEFEHVRIFKGASMGMHVLSALLHILGARFVHPFMYNSAEIIQSLPRVPTFRLLEEWDLLPSSRKLFPVPSPGAQDMVLSMIHAAIKLQPDLTYVISLLETKASQIQILYRDRPSGVCFTQMRDFVKQTVKEYRSIVNVKDFDLVIAAYALKIFGRWVQEERTTGHLILSNGANEGERKKKKTKKEEKIFTRAQYEDALMTFLSRSNNMPLVQQDAERLPLLLRVLLCLVQAVPPDRVLSEITRFFLRKHSDELVSPTEVLSALDEWKNVFRTLENFEKPEKINCFESARALCIALRIYFDYARASERSDQWVRECDALFKHCEQCITVDDRTVILVAYLDVLEHNWRTHHTHKEKLLEVLELGQKLCPYDGSIIRRRINLSSGLMEKFKIQHMLNSTPSKNGDPTLDMYSSLALLYLEKNRVAKLTEAGALPLSDVVAEITRKEASQRRDPALWRLAMAQARSSRFLSETHVLASAQCGWSRHLHIDCVALTDSSKKCKEIISLMEERGVHVFTDLDYLELLKSNNQIE